MPKHEWSEAWMTSHICNICVHLFSSKRLSSLRVSCKSRMRLLQDVLLWIRRAKNWDASTGPLAHLLLRSFARALGRSIAHLLFPKLVGWCYFRCPRNRLIWTIVPSIWCVFRFPRQESKMSFTLTCRISKRVARKGSIAQEINIVCAFLKLA